MWWLYILIPVLVYMAIGALLFCIVVKYIQEARHTDKQCATVYEQYAELRGWLKARAALEALATLVFLWLPVVCGWKRFPWFPQR